MQRRQLLSTGIRGLLTIGLGAGLAPRPAWAMGGTLPDLGARAPDFSLDGVAPGPGGQPSAVHVSLSDCSGSWIVLYFYPRDFTSGCTLEARGFQSDLATFKAAQARIIGVSADDPDQHASFCGSEGLQYTLLSDPRGSVSQRYGSWLAPFSQRHTFLIDPSGILQARWTAVRPVGHSQEVLNELRRLQDSSR